LTAAHCCRNAERINAVFADLEVDSEDPGEFTLEIDINDISIHPDYTDRSDGSGKDNFKITVY